MKHYLSHILTYLIWHDMILSLNKIWVKYACFEMFIFFICIMLTELTLGSLNAFGIFFLYILFTFLVSEMYQEAKENLKQSQYIEERVNNIC